jgi:hypothetical protein
MCSGVWCRDSVVCVAFRYAPTLYRVRYSEPAKHSIFAKVRLHVSWSPPKQEELYVSIVKYTTEYSNIYNQNLKISEGRMLIITQIYSYYLEVCREPMLYNCNAQTEETSSVIMFIQIVWNFLNLHFESAINSIHFLRAEEHDIFECELWSHLLRNQHRWKLWNKSFSYRSYIHIPKRKHNFSKNAFFNVLQYIKVA